MHRLLQLLSLALLVGPLALPAAAQKGVHKDPRIGFELKPPKEWQQIPVASSEEWIVAKYQSPKEDQTYHAETQSAYGIKPELVVIAFLKEVIERADVQENEDEGEKSEVQVRVGDVYRNYEEYLEKTKRGFYITADDKGEVNGLPARMLTVRLDEGGPPIRQVAWLFETEIGQVAVQMICWEEGYDKHKSTFERTLKSFKLIPRTESLDTQSKGGFVSAFFGDLDLEGRKLRRQETERQEWAVMSAGLPEGWSASEINGVNVLNHSDESYAKKCVERIKSVRRWADETFPQVGSGEYTRTPILRVCKDRDEERSFLRGTGLSGSTEIVTHKDTTFGATSGEWTFISERTLRLWFYDRDFELWINLPPWLGLGMSKAVGLADVKGKSLDFGTDYFKRVLQQLEGEPLAARSLLTLTGQNVRDDWEQNRWHSTYQSMALVRFLIDGKSKKYRQVLPDYLANVKTIVNEIQAEENAAAGQAKKPTNEEEEEAYFAARQESAKAREQRVLTEAMSRTFASWSESDWAAFEREFLDSIE